jgi:Ca2+-binding RTX toxin-like protein
LQIEGHLTDADPIAVSKDSNGNVSVTYGGSPVTITNGPVSASAVDAIDIMTYGGADTIDLSGVTSANGFSSDLDGHVTINGGSGDDTITGSEFADSIIGGDGADSLLGGAGADTIQGQDGADTLIGGADDDSLVGGGGSDTYKYSGNTAWGLDDIDEASAYSGGSTGDTLDFDAFNIGYGATVNLSTSGGTGQGVFSLACAIRLSNGTAIENVIGTSYGDDITGNSLANTLDAGGNDDTANDILRGGAGDDVLYGWGGDDTLYGDSGTDILDGGSGNNTIYED